MSQQEPLSEQKTFEAKFRDAAFKTLRGKFPSLMGNIITFKVVDSDISKGSAVGAFILPFGKEVAYLPVVLSEGTISSCEMLYNKQEDEVIPVTEQIINTINNLAKTGDPKLLKRVPFVEGTKTIIRNMFRPPVSTNPVMAGSTDIDGIPDHAKKALSDFFLNSPDVLTKVAEFYPPELLATKLRPSTKALEKKASEFVLPEVIKLEELTEKVAEALSEEQRQDVLENGFTLLNDQYWSKEAAVDVIGARQLPMDSVLAFDVQHSHTVPGDQLYTGKLLCLNDDGQLGQVTCLVYAGQSCSMHKGVAAPASGSLVAGASPVALEDCVTTLHGKRVAEWESEKDSVSIIVAYAGKDGATQAKRVYLGEKVSVTREAGETFIYSDGKLVCSFVDDMEYGSLRVNSGEYGGMQVFPTRSVIFSVLRARDPRNFIKSFQQLQKVITSAAKRIRISANPYLYTVTEGQKSTQRFNSKGDTAQHLVTSYGLNKRAAEYAIESQDVYLLKKADAPQTQLAQSMQAQQVQEQQPEAAPQQAALVDPEVMNQFISLRDPEMLETGMLASLAENDSIKGTLVDYIPQFSTCCSTLGKIILLYSINEKELVEDHGREQYSKLLSNLRRVFKTLGGIVLDIRKQISLD